MLRVMRSRFISGIEDVKDSKLLLKVLVFPSRSRSSHVGEIRLRRSRSCQAGLLSLCKFKNLISPIMISGVVLNLKQISLAGNYLKYVAPKVPPIRFKVDSSVQILQNLV